MKVTHKKMNSGLEVFHIPMEGYEKKVVAVVMKTGSNAIHFEKKDGKGQVEKSFPYGTAHFLEHRLFRQEWGDAFAKFGEYGASANAFTDGEKTVYYFSCEERFDDNFKLLIDFVRHPFFQKEEVERERDIIASEIEMYDDDPGWRVYYEMLRLLYKTHPVRIPIAGSQESIAEIDDETLEDFFAVGYTTDRMAVVVVGDVDFPKIEERLQAVPTKHQKYKAVINEETPVVETDFHALKMGLTTPIFQMAIPFSGSTKRNFAWRMAMAFLLELLVGESSLFYEEALGLEILEEPLGFGYFSGEGYAFLGFSGTSGEAKSVRELLLNHIEELRKSGIAEEDFTRIQKKRIGQFLRTSQSAEDLAMAQVAWAMFGVGGDDVLKQIKKIKKSDVEDVLKEEEFLSGIVLSVVE
ncbi:MAG: pitrilysin family protein [Bacillota bacterium]